MALRACSFQKPPTTWEKHWSRALKPHLRERISFIPHLHELLEASRRLILTDEPPDLGLRLSFHPSNGHTIGLLVSEIELKAGSLFFVSDLVPGLPWVHLPITMGYDRFAELLVEEKRNLFEKMSGKELFLFFTHDPKVACAHLKFKEGKYAAEPVELVSLI